MTARKTIAIFGAGSGLGASLAKRFGREGYRVALIARRDGTLQDRVSELSAEGNEAMAFPADLADIENIPGLVCDIEDRLGPIDVAVYAPVPLDVGFVPAVDYDAVKARSMADIFAFAPIEVAHAVLPGMLARGSGAIVIVSGLSAVHSFAGMSGPGPLMAAARNYILTLNQEVMPKGVYAGSVSIGGSIDRSASHRALVESGMPISEGFPVIDPDDIAQEIWTLVTQRDRAEAIIPPMPAV